MNRNNGEGESDDLFVKYIKYWEKIKGKSLGELKDSKEYKIFLGLDEQIRNFEIYGGEKVIEIYKELRNYLKGENLKYIKESIYEPVKEISESLRDKRTGFLEDLELKVSALEKTLKEASKQI